MTHILDVRTFLPSHQYTHEEAVEYYGRWVSSQPSDFIEKAMKIFHSSYIEERHTMLPAEVIFSKRSFEESNEAYKRASVELAYKALKETLDRAAFRPEELDVLITTSCTGFMIPSVNVYLANKLGLRSDVMHIPITEMGCVAGVSGLIYAHELVTARPGRLVAVLSFEFPSNTIQLEDFSWDNIIGTAIFSDGLSCALLGEGGHLVPRVLDAQMIMLPETSEILGYDLTNTGFRMRLHKSIPTVVRDNLEGLIEPFLKRNGLRIPDVDHYIVHPGGHKILDMIEERLIVYGKNVDCSRKIMNTYGNMSSATVLFILKEIFFKARTGQTALLLSFGPGFAANQILIGWRG